MMLFATWLTEFFSVTTCPVFKGLPIPAAGQGAVNGAVAHDQCLGNLTVAMPPAWREVQNSIPLPSRTPCPRAPGTDLEMTSAHLQIDQVKLFECSHVCQVSKDTRG